jgi:hypothetical protein
MANNLELSQFASFLEVNDDSGNIYIARTTEENSEPFVGIGTNDPQSKLHLFGSLITTKDTFIGGITTTNGAVSLEGPVEIRNNKQFTGFGATVGVGISQIPAALSVGGDLFVLGSSYYNSSSVFAGGSNTFYNNVAVYGQFITTSFNELQGPTQILGITTVANQFIVENNLSPAFSTDKNAALYVDGGVAIQRDVYIKEALNVRTLNVDENSTFLGDVGIQTNLTVTGDTNLENTVVSGVTTFTNKVRITDDEGTSSPDSGALVVTGGVGFSSDLNVGRNLRVNGVTNIDGDLLVVGEESTFSSNIISLGSSITSDIFAIGLFSSDLLPKIADAYDLGSIDRRWGTIRAQSGVFEEVDINNDLTSFGNVLFGGNLVVTNGMDVTGVTTFNSGFISSSTSIFQNVVVNGSITLNGPSIGNISTATRALTVDVSTIDTPSDFYIGFFDTSIEGEGRNVYVDSGLSYNPFSEELTVNGDLIIDGGEIRTNEANSSFDFFITNVVSARFCTTAQSLLFGNDVGVTTFRHPLVSFNGNIQVGSSGTSSILSGDGFNNITLNSNQSTEFIGDIVINGDRLDVQNSSFYLADTNAVDIYAFGSSSSIFIGQSNVGFTSIRSPITIFEGDIRILGNDIRSSSNVTNITLVDDTKTIFSGDIQINNNRILANDTNVNITLDSNVNTIFSGYITIGGDEIKASNGQTNIFLTGNTLTSIAGDLRVEGNDIQDGSGIVNMTLGSNFVEFKGDIKILGDDIRASDGTVNISLESNTNTRLAGDLTVGGDEIRASDDALAITLSPTTGSVGISSNLTVANNLIVNGTTVLKSNQVKIKDKLVNIGLVNNSLDPNDLIDPISDDNKDVGVVFNYYDTQSRKAAVYWDDSVSRITLASRVVESSEVLTASSYGDVEIGGLWVNDCAGQSSVISCSDGVRVLSNVVVDGGKF